MGQYQTSKRNDKKQGKEFTKLIREITVAAKQGADKSQNPRLRLAIDKALSQNMNKQTIERAVTKEIGQGGEQAMDEILYEGYGPGGSAIIVECLSDNRNRTVSEVRHAFTKHGGNLGTAGSVSFMFDHKGIITIANHIDEQTLLDCALEAGAEDVIENDADWQVITKKKMYQISAHLTEHYEIQKPSSIGYLKILSNWICHNGKKSKNSLTALKIWMMSKMSISMLSQFMIILGIDPGSHITGFGIIEKQSHGRILHRAHGTIKPKQTELNQRIYAICCELKKSCNNTNPQALPLKCLLCIKTHKQL